ncbi:MAG: hypothetical protein ACUVYA_07250 [Planctomycetota bacterium]
MRRGKNRADELAEVSLEDGSKRWIPARLDAPKAAEDRERLDVEFALAERLYKRGHSAENTLRL